MAEESASSTTWHDRIFKEFFHRFLPQFVRIFFPEEASHLNFDGLRFLDKELVINLPEQTLRITDVVAEVATLAGGKETILVHVEIEANPQRRFPRRMFEYYSLLRVLRQQSVLPIALVLRPGVGGLLWQVYTEDLFGREILRFQYGQVGIRDISGEEYLRSADPVAATLSMLMEADDTQRPVQKLAALQRIIASGLTDGDKLFLIELIGTYLPTAELMDMGGAVMEQIADIEMTIFEKMRLESRQAGLAEGREEGLEAGREEGELLGKRLLLRRLLTHRFGDLPQDTVQRIELIRADALFDLLVEQSLTATTINELRLPALPTSENAGSA